MHLLYALPKDLYVRLIAKSLQSLFPETLLLLESSHRRTARYLKSSAKIAPFKHLIDLFISAESRFFSQTNQFPSIDHMLYRV